MRIQIQIQNIKLLIPKFFIRITTNTLDAKSSYELKPRPKP